MSLCSLLSYNLAYHGLTQGLRAARQGKVVAPPYEKGYDSSRFMRHGVLPPPAYQFQRPGCNGGKVEVEECLPMKMAPDVALDMRSSPFYLAAASKVEDDRLVPINSPFRGLTAAATTAHRKVSASQYGMSRMY